jgi:hypothetical protein
MHHMRNTMIHHTMKRVVVALGIVALGASASAAQQASAGPKWQGWLGCWTPAPSAEAIFETPASGMFVCISPTANADVVTFTTIENGKQVSQQTVDASGKEQPLGADKCNGAQRAKWSDDQRRLFLSSAATCEGLRTATSAILSITPSGDWLDVRGVNAAGTENVRVARYRDAGLPSTIPAEIASALRGRGMASENARIATGASLPTTAVVEASRSAEPAVVQAWLLELGQRFAVDAATLKQLAKAGVPGKVTDAMVAASYPRAFQVARAERRGVSSDDVAYRGRRITAWVDRDPWLWGASGYGAYGYGPYGYGYSPYGYGYSSGGGYYGGYYSPPIIIVNGSQAPAPHGQVVKGRGYTQTPPSSSGSERPASPSYSPPSSTSSSPSPAPSSSGSSSSGSSSSGRTAQPRNP